MSKQKIAAKNKIITLMREKLMKSAFVKFLMCSAIFVPAAAFAQNATLPEQEAEEVIVTAQKRAQGLSSVPISMSAVTGKKIENYGQTNMEQISSSIPNLKITQTAIANRIAIRGIASGDNKGFEQSAAMFVDGIYYGRDQLSRMPLVDLERVEILRGPQPTLFGKNAIAGAVSVVSRRPTNHFEGSLRGSYEFNHDEKTLTGVVSGPISDKVRARLVGNYRSLDGYFRNTRQNRSEPNSKESFVRGLVDFQNGAGFSGDLKLELANFKTKGQPREIFNPIGIYSAVFSGALAVDTSLDYVRADGGYESENEIFNSVANLNFELGANKLTSVTGYLKYDTQETIDVDFVNPVFLDGTNLNEAYSQISQEFRITSPSADRFNYIAGVYYQKSELDVSDKTKFAATFLGFGAPFNALGDTSNDRIFKQDSELYSVFAQGEYALMENLKITAGARFNREDKSGSRSLAVVKGPLNTFNPAVVIGTFRALNIEAHSIAGSLSEDSFTPMANVQYKLNPKTMLYASFARGTKAGGFDVRSNSLATSTTVARPGTFKFDNEEADNFEAGVKYKTRGFAFNISVYNTKYTDLQVNIFDGTLNFNVKNAAGATTKGVEADMRWAVDDHLTLSGSVAYLDFAFTNFKQGQCYFGQVSNVAGGFCDYTGKRNALSPEWTGNLNADFSHPLTTHIKFGANLNFDWSSEYLASANLDPNTLQDAYIKMGARLALSEMNDRWELALVARNITSERIIQTAGAAPLATTITGGRGIAYNGIFDRPASLALAFATKF